MTLKEIFVADLKATLEETSNIMADRIILESLAKHGSVSLEEAEFYDSLVRRVITEAAEEFVPESLTVPTLEEMGMDYEGEAQEGNEGEEGPGLPIDGEGEDIILTGEDGTVYSFNTATKELIPVEGAEGSEEAEDGLEDLESNEADHEDSDEPETFSESTEVEAEAQEAIEESTEVEAEVEAEAIEESTEVELTESQMIVSNLIKSLGN